MPTTVLRSLRIMCLAILTLLAGCCASAGPRSAAPAAAGDVRTPTSSPAGESRPTDWHGVYISPAEIVGYTSTVLAIEPGLIDPAALRYRMRFRSDRVSVSAIQEKEGRGDALAEGDRLYLPRARGSKDHGEISLSADLDRYTRTVIRGRTVLLRDDALKAYRERNRLYDYGILIKVSDGVEPPADLGEVKHESVKVLYDDPSKGWRDPFVHGPNPR